MRQSGAWRFARQRNEHLEEKMSKKDEKLKPEGLSDEARASREAFAEAGKVAHIEASFEKTRALHNRIDTYFADEIDDPDWKELKRTAKFNFPDVLHSRYQELSPVQKLYAIADCEGWSKSKFASVSGFARNTIITWSKRADVLLFQRDYMVATGGGDPHKEYSAQAHKALRFYAEVLDSQPSSLEEKQFKFKVAQYVTDRAHGPIGKMEVGAVDVKRLTEELRKVATQAAKPTSAEVESLFSDDAEGE